VASGTATFRLKCTHGGVLDYISSDFTATTTWQRFTFSATFGATIGTSLVYGLQNGSNGTAKSVIFYGFQLEANAAYATSYIPTTTAAVTRLVDAASKTGVSSLIGQTEGVMFSDFNYKGNAKGSLQIYPFYIGQGTASNSVTIGLFEDALLCRVFVGGTPQNYFTSSTLSIGRHKVAFLYANNNLKLFLDGVLIQTDTSATIPTCDQIYIGASGTTVTTQLIEVNTNALWKTILTDAQLVDLTGGRIYYNPVEAYYAYYLTPEIPSAVITSVNSFF
jgi:hypothetical protein